MAALFDTYPEAIALARQHSMELGIDAVRFTGPVPQAELVGLLQTATVADLGLADGPPPPDGRRPRAPGQPGRPG